MRNWNVKRWTAGATLLLLLSGACASGADAAAVDVDGFRFQPESIEVAAGTTVTWTNRDNTVHTATSGTPEAPDGVFDERFGQDESASVTFDEAGTYPYFCAIHDSMRGEVRVS